MCFDIHTTSADSAAVIQRNVFDSLVFEDSGHRFHPWLATSWRISRDGKSYTFHLRHDVTFSDGTAFTADAVKANFQHVVAPSTKSQYAVNLLGPYTGTDIVDRYTVRVNFSRPFVPFLQGASTAYLGFYSPRALARNGDKLCAGGPDDVGTGPFVFDGYTKGLKVVLKRNPAYHWAPTGARHDGPAHLRSLVFRILPEDSTRVGALMSGQIDGADEIPPLEVRTVKADSDLSLARMDKPGVPYSLYLNTASAPLDDQRVRRAVQESIDVALDVRTVYFGQYKRAWSPLSPTTPSFDPSTVNSWHYDPGDASRLLDAAGWTGRDSHGYRTKAGRRLSLFWPALPAAGVREQRGLFDQAVQADLAHLGIEVLHPNLTAGEFNARESTGRFQLFSVSWARAEADMLRQFFHSTEKPPAGDDLSYLSDAQVDGWTSTGATADDQRARDDAYARTQRRVLRLGAVVPLYVPASIDGLSRDVHGFTFDANAWPWFYDTWKA